MKKYFTFVLFPLLVFAFFTFFQYQSAIEGFETNEKVSVSVEYGTSVKDVANVLQEKGVIKQSWTLLLYLKWYKLENTIQAGDFVFTKGTAFEELVKSLSNAQPAEIPLRILEGQTIQDIDDILTQKKLIQAGEFIKCTQECSFPNHNFVYDGNLEGYLFPDTYFVTTKDFDIEHFIRQLLYTFEKRLLTEENKAAYKEQGRTLHDVVIMASIVEREERSSINMPIVSGILWKRLDEGIALGADATTRYYEGNKSGVLLKEDFEQDNPYNTRRVRGLPPTAIGNPGYEAFQAALYPQKTDYYYYLHDTDGVIHYAVTNDEHNNNRWKYLK